MLERSYGYVRSAATANLSDVQLARAGLFLAPGMVGESLKGTTLAPSILADLGYRVSTQTSLDDGAGAPCSLLVTADMESEAAAIALLRAVQQGSCLSASSPFRRGALAVCWLCSSIVLLRSMACTLICTTAVSFMPIQLAFPLYDQQEHRNRKFLVSFWAVHQVLSGH
jgi:hypothetical protein